jgi:hypothetical protein
MATSAAPAEVITVYLLRMFLARAVFISFEKRQVVLG